MNSYVTGNREITYYCTSPPCEDLIVQQTLLHLVPVGLLVENQKSLKLKVKLNLFSPIFFVNAKLFNIY